jgi:hypothetical protein
MRLVREGRPNQKAELIRGGAAVQIELQLSDADVKRIVDALAAKLADVLPKNEAPPDGLVSEPAAAAEVGVEPHVLRDARGKRQIEFFRIGKAVRYSRQQIEAYKQRCRRGGAE